MLAAKDCACWGSNMEKRKEWKKPVIRKIVAGSAESQRSSGNPDAKFGKPGAGGQYS